MTARSTDFDVRSALVAVLLGAGVPRRDIRHELTLDTSSSEGRADVVLLREHICGIEIKSGSDDLGRVASQRRAYGLAFDAVGFVVDERHREAAHRAGFWGWWPYEPITGIPPYVLQDLLARREASHASPRCMAQLLWCEEIEPIAGVKTRWRALDRVGETMCLRDLRPRVIEALRNRPLNKWEEAFWKRYDAPKAVAA